MIIIIMEIMICIPKEEDFRRWIKEKVKERLIELKPNPSAEEDINPLTSRADTGNNAGKTFGHLYCLD